MENTVRSISSRLAWINELLLQNFAQLHLVLNIPSLSRFKSSSSLLRSAHFYIPPICSFSHLLHSAHLLSPSLEQRLPYSWFAWRLASTWLKGLVPSGKLTDVHGSPLEARRFFRSVSHMYSLVLTVTHITKAICVTIPTGYITKTKEIVATLSSNCCSGCSLRFFRSVSFTVRFIVFSSHT